MSRTCFDRATGDVLVAQGHRTSRDVGLAALWLAWRDGDERAAAMAVVENYTRGRDDAIPSAWG